MSKTTYTVREVACVLGVAPVTVYRLLRENKLASTQVGEQFRITAVTLRKFLRLGARDDIVVPPEPEQAES